MTTPRPGPTGAFRVDRTGTWTWSEDLYAIYGFEPGDVVPSSELVSRHLHPDDRDRVEILVAQALETGAPFSLWHRVVTVHGSVRQVVLLSAGEFDEQHDLVGIRGYVVDLTEPVRLAASHEVDDALEQMSRSRPLIEQAKGGLMLVYGIDEQAAFGLLRDYSQLVNVKVRDVASSLMESAAAGGWPVDVRKALDGLATRARSVRVLAPQENPGA